MAEFKDAPVWRKWAFICMAFAISHLFFSYASLVAMGGDKGVEACLVIGYIGMIVAIVLAVGVVFTDELNSSKVAEICWAVFAFVGGK